MNDNQPRDSHYLDFFECFGRQQFFEAHEVLEPLWLAQRQGPDGSFYQGLIQLAGAFVHWQKRRPGPAVALFRLAQVNLRKHPSIHKGLNVTSVLAMIDDWLRQLRTTAPGACPPMPTGAFELRLETPAHARDRCDRDLPC